MHFKFGSKTSLALALEITLSGPLTVRVTTATSPSTIVNVAADETLYVYHADHLDPNKDKLEKKEERPKKGSEDLDFKWYYSLVEPRGASFSAWAAGHLPAPVYDPPDMEPSSPPFPSVSTCFPAWI
jgi:hypothetical protein